MGRWRQKGEKDSSIGFANYGHRCILVRICYWLVRKHRRAVQRAIVGSRSSVIVVMIMMMMFVMMMFVMTVMMTIMMTWICIIHFFSESLLYMVLGYENVR